MHPRRERLLTRSRPRVGPITRSIGAVGAVVIAALIWLFGRTHRRADIAWLMGPIGKAVIGDAPYADVAAEEGLTVERDARDGGLVPSFEQLRSEHFDPSRAQPLVREFYEHTTRFVMDVWSQTYFPSNLALFLLVKTISRQVNQLNFPLSPLDTAHGMISEIISLRTSAGAIRYTGWFRTLAQDQLVLYTGFYMTQCVPSDGAPCVKVVFPMPNGNATVVLRPALRADGSLVLDSSGQRFGDAGFYRIQARDAERARVWQIRTLRERFHVYESEPGVLRCDHAVRFLGLPVLTLHYKIVRRG
ncbi:MAG: hypothetical protein M3Y87_00690 [Myxococcota bacterium]|nr:hypothetical protein [Myxococcota bacterium]